MENEDIASSSRARESSAFEVPKYSLSFADDFTLQWEPPLGSPALAIALSYHFPIEENLECKMRAASRRFLVAWGKRAHAVGDWRGVEEGMGRWVEEGDEEGRGVEVAKGERINQVAEEVRGLDVAKGELQDSGVGDGSVGIISTAKHAIQPSQLGSTAPADSALNVVMWNPERSLVPERRRRRYGEMERRKVAANRGYACEEHRRRKVKVRLQFLCIVLRIYA
jgi:hypothetical protein